MEQHETDDDNGQCVYEDLLEPVGDEELKPHDVVCHPGHDLPRLLAAEEAQGQHL